MNKTIFLTGVALVALTTVTYADTMRDLTSGSAVSGSDVFVTRQGADTTDTTVTADQLSTFMTSGGDLCDFGDVTCASLTDSDVIKYNSGSGAWENGTIGNLFDGSGTNSILMQPGGSGAQAYQAGDVAIGNGAIAGVSGDTSKQLNTAIGDNASATGRKATALGYNTDASGLNCVSIGDSATCSGAKGVAIGNDVNVTGSASTNYSIGIGSTIDIDNDDAIGIGQAVTITHDDAIVLGKAQSSEYADQFKYGAKYLALGEIGTSNRDACSAAHEGAIIYNPTDNQMQLCDSSLTWVEVKTGSTVQTPFCVPLSDENTAITAGTSRFSIAIPTAIVLTDVQLSAVTAPTGSVLTVDVNEAGASILSTKLTIDATETDSSTAATAAVISDSAIAANSILTFDIDTVGSTIAGTGVKVCLIGQWQ